MITVAQARETARARLRSRLSEWTARAPEAPALIIALKPPTEREMRVDENAAEQWAREWSAFAVAGSVGRGSVEVDWETRTWRSIGQQCVPVRVRLNSVDAVAEFVGGDIARDWRRLSSRADVLRDRFGGGEGGTGGSALASVIRRHAAMLLRLDDQDFRAVVDASVWLAENPVAGMRPRQLPIRGVDTKWFAAHRSLVTALHSVATSGGAFSSTAVSGGVAAFPGVAVPGHELGIVDADPLIRLRILDPRIAVGDLTDFAASPAQLDALHVSPRVVFVFENKESLLAMPTWKRAIAVHGSGYAVGAVGRLSWVARAPILYWGDLDSNGFAILHTLRSSHPDVTSVLMDEDTLLAHRDLWVHEATPNRGTFSTLTAGEQGTLLRLRDEGDARLEQERIPWDGALAALRAAERRVDARRNSTAD